MTIYRVQHKIGYTVVNNFICKDKRLSWKAKGIWLYAFSRPDDWEFNLTDLINQSTDGKESVSSGLKELEESGYLQRDQKREDGKFSKAEWVFYETPVELKKLIPETGFTSTVNPNTVNPPLLNTEKPSTEKQQQQAYGNAAVSSKFEYLKKQQAEFNKAKQSYEKPVQPEKPKIYGNLSKIDIPDLDKIEISQKYPEDVVKNAIEWATHESTKLTKGLAPAIKWACLNQPKIVEVKKEKIPIDYSSFNRTYFRQVSVVSHQNGFRLESYGLREIGDYIETDTSKIYFKYGSFLEQLGNFLRKKSINCVNIFNMIKACQEDLSKQV